MARNVFLELKGGLKMPALGYGTWQAKDEEVERGLEAALEAGYRHIDTAFAYENESVIGRVLKRWLASGRLKRDDLFVVTKLPSFGNHPETVSKYLNLSLDALQLSYVDVYLVHSPVGFIDDGAHKLPLSERKPQIDPSTDHIAIWKEMEKQVEAGRTRTIGISNFNIRQIQRILDNAKIPPANLQVELHVYHQQNELVEFCRKNGIVVTAYAPLGSPGLPKFLKQLGKEVEVPDLLSLPEVQEIAAKYGKTTAQVLLRHIIQKCISVIPKSVNAERIRQNIDVFDFDLDDKEMQKLNSLDKGEDGKMFNFALSKEFVEHPQFPFRK